MNEIIELSNEFVVCVGSGRSWLLRWVDGQYKVLEQWQEEVLAANKHLVITTKSIYFWECFPLSSSVFKSESILLASADGERGYYLDGEGKIKTVGEGLEEEKVIGEGEDVYLMVFLGEKLVTASTSDLSKLTLYHDDSFSHFQLQEQSMIRSLGLLRLETEETEAYCLVVGYLNGRLFVYDLDGSVIVSFSHLPPHPVRMVNINPSKMCISLGRSQYLL